MPPPHERHDYTTDHHVGSPTNPLPFLGQDYQKLLHKSLRRNELYIDELFPPNNSSIGTLDKEADLDYNNIKWKRPSVCKQYSLKMINYISISSYPWSN